MSSRQMHISFQTYNVGLKCIFVKILSDECDTCGVLWLDGSFIMRAGQECCTKISTALYNIRLWLSCRVRLSGEKGVNPINVLTR